MTNKEKIISIETCEFCNKFGNIIVCYKVTSGDICYGVELCPICNGKRFYKVFSKKK